MISLLMDHSAEINAVDPEGNTALHVAVEAGRVEAVYGLLKFCPDLSLRNSQNKTAIDLLLPVNGSSTNTTSQPSDTTSQPSDDPISETEKPVKGLMLQLFATSSSYNDTCFATSHLSYDKTAIDLLLPVNGSSTNTTSQPSDTTSQPSDDPISETEEPVKELMLQLFAASSSFNDMFCQRQSHLSNGKCYV
nr:uncharacterized protein LOC123762007 [Procambarus clarkii]